MTPSRPRDERKRLPSTPLSVHRAPLQACGPAKRPVARRVTNIVRAVGQSACRRWSLEAPDRLAAHWAAATPNRQLPGGVDRATHEQDAIVADARGGSGHPAPPSREWVQASSGDGCRCCVRAIAASLDRVGLVGKPPEACFVVALRAAFRKRYTATWRHDGVPELIANE